MKLNDTIHFESSANSKAPFWSTRARPLSLGGLTYHGLTDAAHAGRDVGLLALVTVLEATSFAVLGQKFNFAGSLIVGLWVFDIAGALLWHAGSADWRLREAKIKTAVSHEDEEAIREQRPRRYGWLQALGAILIAGPCLFKCLLLLSNPLVFKVMGLAGPALLVAYIGIAVIHFGYTGYALAYLRARRTEKKERSAMLKSGSTDEARQRHPNRIKAHRKHHFVSQLELEEVDNIGGHALRRDMTFKGMGFRYVITTWGRLFDHQVAEMAARQISVEQKSKLGREGLIHQLEIEQSAPLAAAETMANMDAYSPAAGTPSAAEVDSAAPPVPLSIHPEATPSPRAASVAMNGLRQTGVALVLLGCLLGLPSCSKPETKKVSVLLVTDRAIASGEKAAMPEALVHLLAPEKPLLERFVVEPSAIRLNDKGSCEPTNLLPPPATNAVFGTMQDMSQLNSPELEAADRSQRLAGAEATILGGTEVASAATSAARWQQWAQTNQEAGYKVIALRQKARPAGMEPVELPGFGKLTEVSKPEEIHAQMEAELKNNPDASFAVLIDPPLAQSVKVAETPLVSSPAETAGAETPITDQTQTAPSTDEQSKTQSASTSDSPKPPSSSSAAPQPSNVTVSGPFIIMPEKSGDLPKIADPDGQMHSIQRPELAGVVPFEKTSARPTPKTEQALLEVEAYCKREGITEVILHGSADPKGQKDMVEGLSQRRCNMVKDWLLEHGIKTHESIPLGADRVPTTTSEEDYEKHRVVRVFALVLQPTSK